jgi:F-type H+-transporting ATPase subunit a
MSLLKTPLCTATAIALFTTPVYAAGEGGAEKAAGPLFSIFGRLPVSSVITTMWGLMIVLFLVSFFATKNLELVPTRRLQNFMELVLEGILGFLASILGSETKARKYLPLLGTFFMLILVSNYSGMIPGSGELPGLKAPTSTWSVTLGFALIVSFSTHYYGVKEKGIKYFKHFVQPTPVLLPINILEEFTKPLSLSLRLYGNVFGEEQVIAGLFTLVPLFLPLPMQFLGLLFGFIQAFVFTMLASIYLSMATAGH